MSNLTEIVEGKRQWTRDALVFIPLTSNPHKYISQALREATKSDPLRIQDHVVFYVEPIIIELHEDIKLICLMSENCITKEFGYSKWRDLFHLIRTYWSKAHVINE